MTNIFQFCQPPPHAHKQDDIACLKFVSVQCTSFYITLVHTDTDFFLNNLCTKEELGIRAYVNSLKYSPCNSRVELGAAGRSPPGMPARNASRSLKVPSSQGSLKQKKIYVSK